MSCTERGCVMPATKTGYCQSHAWRAPNAPTIDGFATGIRSSLDGRLAPTHQAVSIPKEMFSPRITIEDSTVNPGKKVWIWHMLDGSTEKYGVVGVVSKLVTVNEYIKRMAKDYRILLDPSDVSVEDPPKEEISVQPVPLRARDVAAPQMSQAERVYVAVKFGARSSKEVAAAIPGMTKAQASVCLNQLLNRGRIERYGSDGRANLYRMRGENPVPPVELSPIVLEPVVPRAAPITEPRPAVNDRTAVIAKVLAGKIETPADKRESPLPQDGDYCERLLGAAVQYAAGFAAGGESDAAVSRVLGEIAIEAWIYREAKKITDAAFSQPESDPVPEWAWKAMHAAVMPLLSARFEDGTVAE